MRCSKNSWKLYQDLKKAKNLGDSYEIISHHFLPCLLNLPVCKSTVCICAHRHIWSWDSKGFCHSLGLNFQVRVRVQLKFVYWAKVRVGSFCKREKVGHLECAFQRILPRFDQKVLAFVSTELPSIFICFKVVWAWQGPAVLYQSLGWGSLPHRQGGSLETLNLYRTMLTHNFVTLFSVQRK